VDERGDRAGLVRQQEELVRRPEPEDRGGGDEEDGAGAEQPAG
jgi:hypothetical protein